MPTTSGASLSRRTVLLGAAGLAGTAVLAACGSRGSTSSSNDTTVALTPDRSALIPIFGTSAATQYVVSGSPQRLVFGIDGPDGQPLLGVPPSLSFQLSKDGAAVGAPTEVLSHADGVPIGFYPYRATFAEPGAYQVEVTIDGNPSSVPFDVISPSETTLVPRGAAMVPVETPTVTDARGVSPICTNPAGTCPYHAVTLSQALASGRPTALLVATPKFCQTGVCGPVLDLLTEVAPAFPTVQVVHAEVYTNAEALLDGTASTGSGSGTPAAPTDVTGSAQLTPVVDAYGLTYEPALYLADAHGTIVDRLDNVFDRAEIRAGLQAIA